MRAAFGGSPVARLAGLDGELRAGIDTTPMTGVVLVLLIVFMVVTPALTGPKFAVARTAQVVREHGVTVGIDENGRYYVEDRAVADAALSVEVRRALASAPSGATLYLKAHGDVQYGRVLTMLEAARKARVRRVTAVVDLPRAAR